jgi:hypothetical protein
MEVERAGVGARRHHLHRRDLQGRREADLSQGRDAGGPSGLFNSSLEGNTRRAIDFHEGDKIDERGVEGADPRRRGAERRVGEKAERR